jgi:hypothetical protein
VREVGLEPAVGQQLVQLLGAEPQGVRGVGFNPAALASGMQAIREEGVPSPELYFTNVCSSEEVVSLITPLFPKRGVALRYHSSSRQAWRNYRTT